MVSIANLIQISSLYSSIIICTYVCIFLYRQDVATSSFLKLFPYEIIRHVALESEDR